MGLEVAVVKKVTHEEFAGMLCDVDGGDYDQMANTILAEWDVLPKGAMAWAWCQGFSAGKSRAMRHMSDEPGLSLDAPNPYEHEE